MISINHQSENIRAGWQSGFAAMLPEIERLLRLAFRRLDPESRDEAVEDGVVNCLLSYVRLFKQGRVESATASSLAWYAMLQVRKGRQAGCHMNSKEPLSRYAQLCRGFRVERLHYYDSNDEVWINDIVHDKRSSVVDQVAARLDVAAWLATLCRRTRNIATDLAKGFTTSEVASKHRLSAGRIAQIRKELKAYWLEFQGETALAHDC
jgi:hypothetical protein